MDKFFDNQILLLHHFYDLIADVFQLCTYIFENNLRLSYVFVILRQLFSKYLKSLLSKPLTLINAVLVINFENLLVVISLHYISDFLISFPHQRPADVPVVMI